MIEGKYSNASDTSRGVIAFSAVGTLTLRSQIDLASSKENTVSLYPLRTSEAV